MNSNIRRILPVLCLVGLFCFAFAPNHFAQNPASQPLGPQGSAALQTMINSANDPDLRWPDFAPYQAEIKEFYTRSGGNAAWLQNRKPTAQATAMIAMFAAADHKGLVPDDYDASRWPARLQKLQASATDVDLANFDLAMTVCTMRYVRALHVGRVNPKTLGLKLDVTTREYDLGEFVYDHLVHAGDPAAVVASVEPVFPGYIRAQAALHRYRDFSKQDSGKQMEVPAKSIPPGGTYQDLPRLTQLLRLVGDLPPAATVDPNSTKYDGPVVDAVKRYQLRHGEFTDGHIKPELIKEMNVPLSQRVRQIELTLERWRWLDHSFPQPPVVVNLPEFKLRAFSDDYQIALYKTVIIGKAYGHKSPIFEKQIKYVVFRPYWEVTPTIQHAEIVPHIEKDRDYISKKNFEVVTNSGQVVTDGPISDEVLAELKAGKLHVRQKPGPDNSLGLVKLIFPNDDNVYLHGTEAPELFNREERDLSHGCIRVEKPADLAAWALRHNPGWNLERVNAMMNGTENNVTVNLEKPIPVLLVYGTVAVDENNNVFFFDDIYGYDKELDAVLKKGYPYPTH